MQLVPGVMALAMIVVPASVGHADDIRFLPDDAQIACRAIMPQCFTQEGWHGLCQNNPTIARAHRLSCRKAAVGMQEVVD